MQRWADAAFEQDRILGTLKHNPIFRDYLNGFQDAAYDSQMPEGTMLNLHEYKMQEADPMYVSMEVADMWDYARESFKPEVLHGWDLPAQICFALMPRHLLIEDIEGNEVAFRAVSWIPAGSGDVEWKENTEPDGVWYTLWSHLDDLDDFNRPDHTVEERESWEKLGTWSVLYSGFLPFGSLEDFEAMKQSAEGIDISQELDLRRRTWLLLQSFWRLARQIVPTKEPLPRQLRRVRKRAYRVEDVSVVTLRRQRHPDAFDHEAGEVDWRWQWVVRGHWRNQYYPSIKEHRQIWINPHMKGPEDRPIKPVKRAFEFTR